MNMLSENLKNVRKKSGMTQLEYGEKYGLSRFNVSSYEDGRARPPIEVLISIARDNGVSVEDFFEKPIDIVLTEEVLSKDSIEVGKDLDISNYEFVSQVEEVVQMTESKSTMDFPKNLFDIASFYDEKKHDEPVEQKPFEPEIVKENIDNNHLGIQHVQVVHNSREYELNYTNSQWLANLTTIYLPLYQQGEYRAFEDHNSWYICKQVANWYEIKDASHCFVLCKNQGLLYRKVYNEVKQKGELLLSGIEEGQTAIQLNYKDALEIWEVNAHISYGQPLGIPSYNKLKDIVEDLKFEINRLSR